MSSMNEVLRQRRKELGLTQEQVAHALGVTPPAVNKWESGANYPDLTLLPALARLLKTDPNTLLGFQERLSPQERGAFLHRLHQCLRQKGFDEGLALVKEQVRQFPHDGELLQSAALTLDGALVLLGLEPEERARAEEAVMELYRQVVQNGSEPLASRAKSMLASKLAAQKRYGQAQEVLDTLPDEELPRTYMTQAQVWIGQGQTEKAAAFLEKRLLAGAVEQQAVLCQLVRCAQREKQTERAADLARCGRELSRALGMGEYWEQVTALQIAVEQEDKQGALAALSGLLRGASGPLEQHVSPLCAHLSAPIEGQGGAELLLKPLLAHLKQAEEYEFLRGVPEFETLLRQYTPTEGGAEGSKKAPEIGQ